MYFKCEFPIRHPSISLPAKHIELTSVFHCWSEMGVECECQYPPGKWAPRRSALRLLSTKVVFPSRGDTGKYPPGRLAGAMRLEVSGQHLPRATAGWKLGQTW